MTDTTAVPALPPFVYPNLGTATVPDHTAMPDPDCVLIDTHALRWTLEQFHYARGYYLTGDHARAERLFVLGRDRILERIATAKIRGEESTRRRRRQQQRFRRKLLLTAVVLGLLGAVSALWPRYVGYFFLGAAGLFCAVCLISALVYLAIKAAEWLWHE